MKLRVWWIPQIPMKPFYVDVNTLEEGVKIMNVLAHYDLFQYENRVKGDYANTGGIQEFDTTENEWVDWYDEETGEDNPEEYLANKA